VVYTNLISAGPTIYLSSLAMAAHKVQYQHYIPRFILKRFTYLDGEKRERGPQRFLIQSYTQILAPVPDDLINVFDMSSGQFQLGEVRRTCGTQNLYYNANDSTDPMKIEDLFSKLESETSEVFEKIRTAITDGLDFVDIREKDIHILFKFMSLSPRRSEQYRDEVRSPYRENDFLFQSLFEALKKSGRSGDPSQFWLDDLLYVLEATHEDLLADAGKSDSKASAVTYKSFIESYDLHIWKAAHGYEFFLNESLVDFEGDTQSFLGTEVKETRCQLIWVTTNDLIHLVLPISPEVAVVFCNGSRCWESPFADNMHRLKIPYPQNSLLKNAPHRDIINVHVPNQRRRKKWWPATVAWRVHIETLSRDHHRIITSYSLSHAKSFVVHRNRARFERAKRELEVFGNKRAEVWKSQGFRVSDQNTQRQENEEEGLARPSDEQITRIVDDHLSALDDVLNIINTTREPLPRTKDNALKYWLAVRTLEIYAQQNTTTSSGLDAESLGLTVIHPALRAAFEAAYPPQHPDHRDLVALDFSQFLSDGTGDETFAQLTLMIDAKISELVRADSFHTHWEASATKIRPPKGSISQNREDSREQPDLLENSSLQSIFKATQGFNVLVWMFKERQDILATFVQQIGVPMGAMQPGLVRIRGRRN
jgi:hypothetical protein